MKKFTLSLLFIFALGVISFAQYNYSTLNENYYEQQREIICEEMNRVNPDYKATDYEDLEKEIENV